MPETPVKEPDTKPAPAPQSPPVKPAPLSDPFEPDWPATRPEPQPKA